MCATVANASYPHANQKSLNENKRSVSSLAVQLATLCSPLGRLAQVLCARLRETALEATRSFYFAFSPSCFFSFSFSPLSRLRFSLSDCDAMRRCNSVFSSPSPSHSHSHDVANSISANVVYLAAASSTRCFVIVAQNDVVRHFNFCVLLWKLA